MKKLVETLEGINLQHVLYAKNNLELIISVTTLAQNTDVEYLVKNISRKESKPFSTLEAASFYFDNKLNQDEIQYGLDNLEKLIGY